VMKEVNILLDKTYILACVVFGFIIFISLLLRAKNNNWVSRDKFESEKRKLKASCNEDEVKDFISFLKNYKGGYVRRRSGKIIYQDYTGKEKGDLKGIFYHVISPNSNLSVSRKEEFRELLIKIGVNGIENRPDYEVRDSKLKNKATGDEYRRKEVGNIGEQIVRDALKMLENRGYSVINGPVLKYNDVCREYDHIVIGSNGVFALETKAFGMTEGKATKASLFIDPEDKWIIRKNKVNRDLESPTLQIIAEKELLQEIVDISSITDVHSVLVLCNTELFIKNNMVLPYEVVRVDKLVELIGRQGDLIAENDRMNILSDINRYRIN